VDGRLSSEDLHRVEEHLIDCSLCSEALDGYAMMPVSVSALDEVNASIDKVVARSGGGNTYFSSKSMLLVAASLALVIVSVVLLINSFKSDTPELLSELSAIVPVGETTAPVEVTPEQIAEEERMIDVAEIIPEQEQITYERALNTLPPSLEDNEIIDQDMAGYAIEDFGNDENDAENADPEPVVLELQNNTISRKFTNQMYVERSNVDLTYSLELKVVDYSGFYKTNIRKTEPILGGTSADKENKDTKQDPIVMNFKSAEIPYARFLEGAMKKFELNNYKGALRDFRTIIDQYPDDVNAHFYGGLCNYNLKRSNQAIAYFDKVISNFINSFNEESRWYKSLSLIQKRDMKTAEELLRSIIAEKGFYAVRASTKLESDF